MVRTILWAGTRGTIWNAEGGRCMCGIMGNVESDPWTRGIMWIAECGSVPLPVPKASGFVGIFL